MADTVPPGQRIDRATLERVISRAAQLQAGERDLDDGLTEDDLFRLGGEVGIPAPYLRQALLEARTQAAVPAEGGVRTWLVGPRWLVAERTVKGAADDVRKALEHWMTAGELLVVKRRFPDQVAWEPQRGTLASLKRSLRVGGRDYRLARAREVSGQVTAVATDRAHVRLIADVGPSQSGALGGAAFLTLAGIAAAAVLFTLGFAELAAVLPAPAGLAAGFAVARGRRKELDPMQTALEQVLDRLEHGETGANKPRGAEANPLNWIAEEIRKQLRS